MTPRQESNIPWWLIVLCFVFQLWPIALILLFMNLGGVQLPMGRSRGRSQNQYWSYQYQQKQQQTYQRRQTPPAGATGDSASSGATAAPGSTAASGPIYTGRSQAGQGPAQQGTAQAQGSYNYGYAAQKAGAKGSGQTSTAGKPSRFKIRHRDKSLAGFLTGGGLALSGIMLFALVDEWSTFGLSFVSDWFPLLSFFCAGLVMLGTGLRQSRRLRRFTLYMGVIGQQSSVFLADLAGAAGVSEKKVISDLQKALADGLLPMGYIDRASGRLVLTDQGYQAPEPQSAPEPQVQEEKAETKDNEEDEEDAILRQIREVNAAIPGEEMSRKIERIEEITRKILAYQRNNPTKAHELRQFLNYYLPTTLKLLNAYAQMDAQGVEGENITAAKARIEGMMDKVVEGFEKQLDQLFKTDAMDIATDVDVLERMLEKDGLGSGMTLGGS